MFSFDANSGEIHLYDQIGPEWAGMVGFELSSQALDAMDGRDITMYLSSPGGSVDTGTDIFNALQRYKGKKTIIVDAIAASMGSYILQAADVRVLSQNSKVMVHNPWSVAMGDAASFRKEADRLDKYREAMVPAYAERTKKTAEEVRAIMDAETWYVGQEAVDAGFADKVQGKAKGGVDLDKLARWASKIPDNVITEEKQRTMSQMRRSMTRQEARALADRFK